MYEYLFHPVTHRFGDVRVPEIMASSLKYQGNEMGGWTAHYDLILWIQSRHKALIRRNGMKHVDDYAYFEYYFTPRIT